MYCACMIKGIDNFKWHVLMNNLTVIQHLKVLFAITSCAIIKMLSFNVKRIVLWYLSLINSVFSWIGSISTTYLSLYVSRTA